MDCRSRFPWPAAQKVAAQLGIGRNHNGSRVGGSALLQILRREEEEGAALEDGSADGAAELVQLEGRPDGKTRGRTIDLEIVVGVEHRIAEELVCGSVIGVSSGARGELYQGARAAVLRAVIRGLDGELLQRVRIGQDGH